MARVPPLPKLPAGALRSPLALAMVLLAALAGAVGWAEHSGWLYAVLPALAPPPLVLAADGTFTGTLLKVRDGDTVEVRYHDLALAVRLLNVDTAESVHPDQRRNTSAGAETSEWAKQHLAGASVRIEFARKGWHIEEDHYGRALAYLWIDLPPAGAGPEDELYNETLIRQGFSAYRTEFGPAKAYHQRFLAAESEARREHRGVWAGTTR
jgi:micrococcal nuclease